MKNILKKHDISLRLLSLLLSVVLWAVVMDMDNPERPRTFDNIPVRISGETVLQQQTGLSLIEGADSTVKITLRGPSKTLGDIKASQIAASVDISGLTEANEYDLPVSITVSRSGLEVEYVSPSKVHVRVDKVANKDIPVDVNVTGNPTDGCRAGKPTSPVSTITVQGPAAELANVAKAVAVVDVTGAESTLTNIECPVTLYDKDGTVVTSQHITSKTEKIKVTVPMYSIDTLPLTVTLKDGGKLTAQQVRYTINPVSVKVVASDQAALSEVKEINLGEIDLGSVRTGVPIELSIRDKLPDGVSLDSNQPDKAKVTITVDGIATRKVQVSKFAPNDPSAESTPYSVKVLTGSVEIELRGNESELQEVATDSLSIGLTFDSVSLGVGRHKVKGVAAAIGLPSDVTLVEEDIEVEIEITENSTGSGGENADVPSDEEDSE